jgi:hypothetical protein
MDRQIEVMGSQSVHVPFLLHWNMGVINQKKSDGLVINSLFAVSVAVMGCVGAGGQSP